VRARAQRWIDALGLLRRVRPGLLVTAVLLNVALGLLPLAFIVATGVLLAWVPRAAGHAGDPWAVVGAVLLVAVALFVAQQMLAPFQSGLGETIGRQVDGACIDRLMSCSLTGLPVAELERSEVLDVLTDAAGGFERAMPTPGDAAAAVVALVARYSQLIAAAVVTGVVLGPVLGVVVGLTALIVRFGQRGSLGRIGELFTALAPHRRRVAYLRRSAAGPGFAKEMRVNGLLGWYLDRHDDDTRAHLERLWAGRRRILFRPFLVLAAAGLAGGGVTLVGLSQIAAGGGLTLLQLGVAVQAVLIPLRFGAYFPECDVQTQYGLQGLAAIRRLETLAGTTARGGAAPGPLVRGVRFDGVTFGYPGRDRPVLDGLDLTLAAGRSTAIVGLNGAGKTTLVKLLAALYEPDAGRILLDDQPLSGVDTRAWHRRIAVIFQDFVRYELSAAENIGMAVPGRVGDRAALLAAARRAGALDLITDLPDGLDTVLAPQYEGGVGLSGGQWQRIALARALLAVDAGASLLVLDEPTAALDVRAEAEFFDRFLDVTSGVTSVIIAHRFSSVRRADHIVVLDGGRVAEQGDHEELMALGGRYAGLFALQARQFAAADSGDGSPPAVIR
jgi:ATP-binding cassette subfamily B protein